MSRRAKVRMRITDLKIEDNKAIFAVEIRKGNHVWRKAYGVTKESLKSFDIKLFKQKVLEDAQQLIADKEIEVIALRRVKEFIGPEIILD